MAGWMAIGVLLVLLCFACFTFVFWLSVMLCLLVIQLLSLNPSLQSFSGSKRWHAAMVFPFLALVGCSNGVAAVADLR